MRPFNDLTDKYPMNDLTSYTYNNHNLSTVNSTFRCWPVFVFPDMDKLQALICQPCQLDDLIELPTLSPDIPMGVTAPVEIGFQVPVVCAWCGVVIRYTTGFTQDGISHGMCEYCFAQQRSQETNRS